MKWNRPVTKVNPKINHDRPREKRSLSRPFRYEQPPDVVDVGRRFIETEFSTCELFILLALDADNDDAMERHTSHARAARDAIVQFLPRAGFSGDQVTELNRRLASLDDQFRSLGVIFE